MRKIPVILDGDPGHDDAIAWVLANASPCLKILGVTTVAGNQTIEKTTSNALKICSLIDLDVPIAKGSSSPILSEPIIAPNFHGTTGLDGVILPESKFKLEQDSAVELMFRLISKSDEKVMIISTGPQTNVAKLLMIHPEIKNRISCISVMGGGINKGNWTPAAEFNILEDPEAAAIVFDSNIPIQMCGLDVTEEALIFPEDINRIRNLKNHVASVVADWLDFFIKYPIELGYPGAPLHDPCAVLSITHPELFEMEKMAVKVELNGRFTRGCTVGIPLNKYEDSCKTTVVMNLNREKFVDLIVDLLQYYDISREGDQND